MFLLSKERQKERKIISCIISNISKCRNIVNDTNVKSLSLHNCLGSGGLPAEEPGPSAGAPKGILRPLIQCRSSPAHPHVKTKPNGGGGGFLYNFTVPKTVLNRDDNFHFSCPFSCFTKSYDVLIDASVKLVEGWRSLFFRHKLRGTQKCLQVCKGYRETLYHLTDVVCEPDILKENFKLLEHKHFLVLLKKVFMVQTKLCRQNWMASKKAGWEREVLH